jgi:dolichol kinase
MVTLSSTALIVLIIIKAMRKQDMRALIQGAGVAVQRVAKTASEIDRKVFHLCGLLVPLIYQVLLQNGWSQRDCSKIVWVITTSGASTDMARINIPFVQRNWPLKGILRDREQDQLCGGTYFSLGCTLAIHFFAPVVAMTSIIFLVLGDMSAALIGRSFGKTLCQLGLGPEGKKSVEGSFAMFLVCMLFGCTIFSEVHLREYAVTLGALVATLTELYEPFGLNDNVTIPVLSSLALTFGFARTYSCDPTRNPLLWHS